MVFNKPSYGLTIMGVTVATILGYSLVSARHPITITVFGHDKFFEPNATAVPDPVVSQIAVGGSVPFGSIVVFDSPLRETVSNTSAQLGWVYGLLVALSRPYIYLLTNTVEISDSQYNGTFTAQGQNDGQAITRTIGVTGGTGSFLNAQGTLILTTVVLNSYHFVTNYTAVLSFPEFY